MEPQVLQPVLMPVSCLCICNQKGAYSAITCSVEVVDLPSLAPHPIVMVRADELWQQERAAQGSPYGMDPVV